MRFDLSAKDLKVKELLAGDFLNIELYAISDDYPNNNNSSFTLQSMQNAIQSAYNKPILGYFNKTIGPMGDFEAHNDNGLHYDKELDEVYFDYTSANSEIPLGIIRESDSVEVVEDAKIQGKHWFKITAALWAKYNYKAIKSLLKSRKGTSRVSVEVEVLDSYVDEKGYEIITNFNLLGVTILGEAVKEGIENAHLSVLNYIDNAVFAKKQKALAFAYSALDEYNTGKKSSEQLEDFNSEEFLNKKDKDKKIDSPVVNENPEEEIEMSKEKVQKGGNLDMVNQDNLEKTVEAEVCPDCGKNPCECEAKTEEACGDKEGEACTKCAEEVCPDCGKDPCECEAKTEETCEDKEGEACAKCAEETCPDCGKNPCECESKCNEQKCSEQFENDPIDLNKEPEEIDVETQPMTEIIDQATEAISAPDAVDTVDNVGDGNDGVEEVGVPTESLVEEIDNGEVQATLEVSEGPDGEKAQVVSEEDITAVVSQPDDQAKAADFSSDNKIEFEGEMITAQELFAKYEELKNKYDALIKEAEEKTMATFVASATNFVNGDEVVDSETKESFISEIKEKCNNHEFSSEEEVIKFAKSLLAMYYYENKVSAKKAEKEESFSVTISKTETHINKQTEHNKLRDALDNLNKIN